MPHFIDGIVDGGILGNVGVGGGQIGLGLVVVVIADKIFNRIVGKEIFKFSVELRGQRFIGCNDQGWLLYPLNYVSHGKGLA